MNRTQLPHDNEIHLYYLTLPHHPAELSRLEQFLSPSEKDRAGRLKDERIKYRFIAGRGILREILSGYLGIHPALLHIMSGTDGKPYLADPALTIRFNLSHTGDVLLLAVSGNREVGVDIETMASGKPLNQMAKIAFSLIEQQALFCIPSIDQRTETFYRFWVRKEACMKASGSGFSHSVSRFDVSGSSDEITHLTVKCDGIFWHIIDIQAPHPYCAALAVATQLPTIPPPRIHFPAQIFSIAQ